MRALLLYKYMDSKPPPDNCIRHISELPLQCLDGDFSRLINLLISHHVTRLSASVQQRFERPLQYLDGGFIYLIYSSYFFPVTNLTRASRAA